MRTTTVSPQGFVLASHPGPTVVVTALATGLAVGVGSTLRTSLLVAGAVLTGQLSVGWSNDWLDAARDRAVSRASKPVVSGLVSATALRTGALAAGTVCAFLSLATGVVPGAVHLAAVASAWAYNVRLKATAASWLPYAVSFSLLLLFVVVAQPGRPEPTWWGLLAAALLGVGAHVANVLPDLEDDRATGVSGFPHRLGHARATGVALAALVAATAVIVLGPSTPPSGLALLGGGVALVLAGLGAAVALVRPHSVWPFRLSMAVAAVCVVLLVMAGPDLMTVRSAVTP
ncbi:MAG TPA: UbiA family prenyltransferase [Cellulomonadaceae bacterium]|nr:UbiA family prenyltransferase [Cellulomonadaceae bacterium]